MDGGVRIGCRGNNIFTPHPKASNQLYPVIDGTSELHLSALPTVSGPYEVSGVLYGVFANQLYTPAEYRLEVWSSADGLLWTECDGANRKGSLDINYYSVFHDSANNMLYIAYVYNTGVADEIRLADFDLSTGLWGTLDVSGGPTPFYGDKYSGPENMNFGLVRRSDGSIVVGYTALQVRLGNDRSRMRYMIYDGSWGSAVDIDPIGNSDTTYDRETYCVAVVMDTNERTGFFILDYYGTLYYISLDSAGNLDTDHQIIWPAYIYSTIQAGVGAPVGGATFRIPWISDVLPGTRIYAAIPPILNSKGAQQLSGVPSSAATFWRIEQAGSSDYLQSDENSAPVVGRSMYRVAACPYTNGSLEAWARTYGVTIPWSTFWLNYSEDSGFTTAPVALIQTDGYEFGGCCMNTVSAGLGAFIEVEGTGPFQDLGTVIYWQGTVPFTPTVTVSRRTRSIF